MRQCSTITLDEVESELTRSGYCTGVRATCDSCGNTEESCGESEASVKRCLVNLRRTCPGHGSNFYVDCSQLVQPKTFTLKDVRPLPDHKSGDPG